MVNKCINFSPLTERYYGAFGDPAAEEGQLVFSRSY